MMRILWFVLLYSFIGSHKAIAQESSSILLLDLLQFHNPTGLTTNGQCCDGTYSSLNACPISISCTLSTIVCLDYIQSEFQSNWSSCPLGSKSVQMKINSTSLLNYNSIRNGTPISAIEFELPLISDNSIRIKIFVFYENINVLLNQFYTTVQLDAIHSSSSSSLTHGISQHLTLIDLSKNGSYINQMIISLKTFCRPTFYGKQCSIQCIPNNDCTSSFSCHPISGEKICASGWSGRDCSIYNGSSSSSSGFPCHHGGFYLNNQTTCCCREGYTGSNCEYLSTCTPGITCLNGGTCHPNYDVTSRTYYFDCHCSDGFTGLFCQEKRTCPPTFYGPNCTVQCIAPNSCSDGHFYCNSQGEKICLDGWGPSETCQQKIIAPIFDNECPVSTGCLNGGSCFNGTCCCPTSYTGRLCEISIDPCANNACQNNALCLSTSTGYKCQCSTPLYTGSFCEINQNPCQYSPCQNGICQLLSNSSSFSCICYPGYTGQFCHIKINYCLSQPCENRGICASMATGFICTCVPGFTGPTCSTPIELCSVPPCLNNQTLICPIGYAHPPTCTDDIDECVLNHDLCKNNGRCINTVGSYSCQCNQFYQGIDCSIPFDPCLSDPCVASNSIACTSIMTTNNSIDYNCTCRAGFTGNRCEIELNPCMNNPCVNGQCFVLTPLTWSCNCEPGWTGNDCRDEINECASNPCLNAGVCVDALNKYQCRCLQGFTGSRCQIELNPCSNTPCQNNGTCVNHIVSHSCVCPQGWTGKLCEVNINECTQTLSCHPNATCIDLPGSYQCICPPWLTGPNCLTAVDQCKPSTCHHDGVCVNNYGALPTCHCRAGFTGRYCEVNIDDCQISPCDNNGTCLDQVNSFVCLCPSGYTGLRCQTRLSQCTSSSCLNGGTCRDAFGSRNDDDFICLCPPLFTGQHCEQILNPCTSFPCVHGSCIPTSPTYKCQCNHGYTGPNCETMIDQCTPEACGSNGTCISLDAKFSCCCPLGYTGSRCEELIDLCATNPCSIEGSEECISNNFFSLQCVCKPGFTGKHCEININECASRPCLNGGMCIDFLNSYQCLCPNIYAGIHCERLQDQCIGIQCLNGGHCHNNGANLSCVCANGFHGDNCELIVDYCHSQPCLNGGVCSNTELGPQCSCPTGVTGSLCEKVIDQCQTHFCENNGTCQSLIDHYVCLCPDGFMGQRCEIERNECEPVNPCLNSGRCVDRLNNFSCICTPGFMGDFCEIQINRCQSSPCLNGGICHPLIDSYKCDCPQGYTGSTCSMMINHCASNPCQHNGLCIPLLDAYRCVCLDDYIGIDCERTSNECFSNPCLNDGTCIDHIWNYTCQCASGFTGSNCQMEINYCQSSPCIEGLCINKPQGYDCLCPSSAYRGIHCEIQINQCSTEPCFNGGTCIDGATDFMCLCPPWFSGRTCSERINPCQSTSVCANNGTCRPNYDIKPYGHTCECVPGFTGQMCEINVDDCISQPCHHGRCLDKINGFVCQCYPGYEGILCDTIINQCTSHPCRNDGTCQPLINVYQCHCSSGYFGINCEQIVDKHCLTHSCFNNGTCLVTSNNEEHCVCLHGFTGIQCELSINACDVNPCLHGTCQTMSNGFYSCLCSPGYTGHNCQLNINECDSSPCLHNGLCQESELASYNCICPQGYSGHQCQFGDYQCRSGSCLNNGTCTVMNEGGYHCTCPPGLTGTRCEVDIDECASNPCQNKGICLQSKLNQYQCHCPKGYTGVHCEKIVDPCLSTTCLNNGTCIRTNSFTGLCSCLPGFTGASCQNQINTCLSAPCLNGTCVSMSNSYQCNCYPGYTGVQCDTMINYCASNPCFNNGTCINQATTFACRCPYGFQGRTCVIRIQACQSSPCLNGGTCNDIAPGLHQCTCPPFYRGDFCQLRDSFCLNKPCQNNGICTDTMNGYQCTCQPGYSGTNCTNIIQPCLSHPCLNNGMCQNTNQGLSYQCTCAHGYAGLRCELEMNWCSSNPCQNQGTCLSYLTSFACLCPPLYTGLVCQIPLNNCSLTTCEHGLPLMTDPNSCSCVCADGYTGDRCETPINPCSNDSYCLRGTCHYLSPGVAQCSCPTGYTGHRCDTPINHQACSSCPCSYGQCRPLDEMNDYVCDCYQGYTGKHCETSIDFCKPSPCLYGQCFFDSYKGYRCQCLPGATGENCSVLIDTCASKPCFNQGICVQGLNSYQCVCQSGYAGSHCEIMINQCTSLLCLNNGTCINLPTTPPSAKCQCPSSFTGLQCQFPFAPCASQPCRNLGTCIAHEQTSYSCVCPNGFSGQHCEERVHVCQSQPCRNGGSCSEPAPYYYICQCPAPFYGINCEFIADPCLTEPCRGPLSQCISSSIHHNYTCVCSTGFEGPSCSQPVDPCRAVECQNGGTCVRTGLTTYSCTCRAGFRGAHCDIPMDPCTNTSCIHGLSIRTSPTECQCECSHSFYGKSCEINVCQENPCLTGKCTTTGINSYQCQCPVGFQYAMGTCVDINECRTLSSLCANGGRCLNTYGSYSCFCKPGYYGTNCDIFDPCRSVSCLNNGTCKNSTAYPFWKCQCPDTHTGIHCEETFFSCSSNPCRTGTCENLSNGQYQCQCPPWITGRQCEVPLLPCDSNPCLNNSTCLSLSSTNYTCVCRPLYKGDKCGEQQTDCTNNPCEANGTCVLNMKTGEEVCQCPPGRYGLYCEYQSPCSMNPCRHGTCQNRDDDSFQCTCEPGFTGITCEIPIDVCQKTQCFNGGTCSNIGNGLFVCACPAGYTGSDCRSPVCSKDSCFNGGQCVVKYKAIHCQCPCEFTGSRCETPFKTCSLTTCLNNGTRTLNSTSCHCSCSCPSTFTGSFCQIPVLPANRTYTGQIVIPIDRRGGSSWENVLQCIDHVWNNLNVLLVCPSSFNLTNPSTFHPYCYRIHQQNRMLSQDEAMDQCRKQQTQLVWFQSMDELQEQVLPALITHGYTRDFWTSGMRNSSSNRWQWYLSNNNTSIDIDPSIISQTGSGLLDQSLYVSFDPSTNRRLMSSSPTNLYSTICKISATRLSLNDQTRTLDLTSQQTVFINQSQVMIYNFNYTISPTVSLTKPIQQPTESQYVTMCGAIGNPTVSVKPYIIDICGHYPSITDSSVRLLMETIGSYYSNHRKSITSHQSYSAVPLNIEHFLTIAGSVMTRISFVIRSGTTITLGSNVEPLASVDDMLKTITYRSYQQCTAYIALKILLPLQICVPFDEISSAIPLITEAVSTATEEKNVHVMLKGIEEGVTSSGQSANLAYFLVTINGTTFDRSVKTNLSINPIFVKTIRQSHPNLLCPKTTKLLRMEQSIRTLYAPCSDSTLLEQRLNNALNRAGIFSMSVHIFGVREMVDSFGQVYQVPNIFLKHNSGTWLNDALEFDRDLFSIFTVNQMQRLNNRVYDLSKTLSYLYANPTTSADREYLEKVILMLHQQKNSMSQSEVKILNEEVYFHKDSMKAVHRVYVAIIHQNEQLDGRLLSSFSSLSEKMTGVNDRQIPFSFDSNKIPVDFIKQSHLQQITFTGKLTARIAEGLLQNYWRQIPLEGPIDVSITILQLQDYLIPSMNQFYTVITYIVMDSTKKMISKTCFDPTLISHFDTLCEATFYYLPQTPMGSSLSFIDLQGEHSQLDLQTSNMVNVLSSVLESAGIDATVTSVLAELRFGYSRSLFTRVYYTVMPNQMISQEQIEQSFKTLISSVSTSKYHFHVHEEISIGRADAQQFVMNLSLPLTDANREKIERELTSFNSHFGYARIVHSESIGISQARLYLMFVNGTDVFTQCDFTFSSPTTLSSSERNNHQEKGLLLEHSAFLAQSSILMNNLREMWGVVEANNSDSDIELGKPIDYICPEGKRFVRIEASMKNGLPTPIGAPKLNGIFNHECSLSEAHSIYLIEPRTSDRIVYEALGKAWRQSNHQLINISSEFFIDSTYLTKENETLTRLIYTIRPNIRGVTRPLCTSIHLTNIYTRVPYKKYHIYVENRRINETILSMVHQAIRQSWTKANNGLFSTDDLLIPSIRSFQSDNGQLRFDYLIGLRTDDIGDYSQPSEQLYSQIFNQADLGSFVSLKYKPRNGQEVSLDNESISLFPFDYRTGGPFYGLDWWVILIIILSVFAVWFILCLICYLCFRKRSSNRYHHKISKRPTRRIDVLAREQDPYLRPSLSSLAFDGPYAESMHSSLEDDRHQRASTRTMSSVPELQVRRLSEQDWPQFTMYSSHGLPSIRSHSPSHSTASTRPL